MVIKDILSHILSQANKELEGRIKELKQKFLSFWWDTSNTIPTFYKSYSIKEQKRIEKEISGLMEKVFDYADQYLPQKNLDKMDFDDPIDQTSQYIMKLFNLIGMEVDNTYNNGLIGSTNTFLKMVQSFDPEMDPENIYQALRNIWIMNTLQIYFGLEMGCSDSMFAYSMLYPYTDNMMDNASISLEDKFSLSQNLKRRLEGNPYSSSREIEKKLDSLVGLVEQEFPRDGYPMLFQSLLGIYNAQIKSLIQQREIGSPYITDIPGISFQKGGASVLADGYLLKGKLTGEQEVFCFGLGTFLQLADDIQDIKADKKNSHMTIYSQNAAKWHLDALANKLFHYISVVMRSQEGDPILEKTNELFCKSFYLHIMEAVLRNSDLYSQKYIREIQVHFPVRLAFLKKMRKKLKKLLQKQKKLGFNLNVVSAGLMALTARIYE